MDKARFAFFCGAFILVSVIICGRAAAAFGEKDPQKIVIDEAAGFFTAMSLSSGETGEIVAGFLLFRFFDIVKIPPSRRIEELRRGWGIVMDDVYAGLLSALCIGTFKFMETGGFG